MREQLAELKSLNKNLMGTVAIESVRYEEIIDGLKARKIEDDAVIRDLSECLAEISSILEGDGENSQRSHISLPELVFSQDQALRGLTSDVHSLLKAIKSAKLSKKGRNIPNKALKAVRKASLLMGDNLPSKCFGNKDAVRQPLSFNSWLAELNKIGRISGLDFDIADDANIDKWAPYFIDNFTPADAFLAD